MTVGRKRSAWICRPLVLVLVLVACSGDSLTMSEYSDEVAGLIQRVDGRLDAHAEELFSGDPSVEATHAYLDDRVAGYKEMVAVTGAIDPPDEVVDLHTALTAILATLLEAEEARATFAASVDSVDNLDLIWEGPQSQAVRAAELEAIVLCYAAQERFDATEEREDLSDIPWIPPAMKEIVRTAFGCPE